MLDMDYEGATEIERAWREGLTPDPLLTVSEWSDRHRMLSSKASAEPGRWRTSRTPYLKAIMDCLSPTSPVERVVFMKAAQLGATEMGSNWIGYVIHHAPGPMMAVWPTVEMAKRNSKQRIDPLIEESAALAELIAPARSRDSGNTILAKEFRGGVLVMTGANSAVGFPVREWQKMRERNEALDCYVYARAAASAAGLDRFEERHWRELERQLGMERPPDEPPPIQAFDPDEATHSGGLAASGARHSGRRVIKSRWLTR